VILREDKFLREIWPVSRSKFAIITVATLKKSLIYVKFFNKKIPNHKQILVFFDKFPSHVHNPTAFPYCDNNNHGHC
jgi:hypothetical protein